MAEKQIDTRASTNLELVIDAYLNALFSIQPRSSYIVGSDAKWVFYPLSFVPHRLRDVLLSLISAPLLNRTKRS